MDTKEVFEFAYEWGLVNKNKKDKALPLLCLELWLIAKKEYRSLPKEERYEYLNTLYDGWEKGLTL